MRHICVSWLLLRDGGDHQLEVEPWCSMSQIQRDTEIPFESIEKRGLSLDCDVFAASNNYDTPTQSWNNGMPALIRRYNANLGNDEAPLRKEKLKHIVVHLATGPHVCTHYWGRQVYRGMWNFLRFLRNSLFVWLGTKFQISTTTIVQPIFVLASYPCLKIC